MINPSMEVNNVIFIDEYGVPNGPNPSLSGTHQTQQNIFAIIGVYFDSDSYQLAQRMFANLKKKHLYTDRIAAHDQDMRKGKYPFYGFTDPQKREEFYVDFANLVSYLEYKLVLAIIDKPLHYKTQTQRGQNPQNPYRLAMQFILEKFDMNIPLANSSVDVIIEARGEKFDQQLRCIFANTNKGCRIPSRYPIQGNYRPFFFPKSAAIAGLEIADLLLSSAWRMELNNNLNYLSSKRANNGLPALNKVKVQNFDQHVFSMGVIPKYLKPIGQTQSNIAVKFFP